MWLNEDVHAAALPHGTACHCAHFQPASRLQAMLPPLVEPINTGETQPRVNHLGEERKQRTAQRIQRQTEQLLFGGGLQTAKEEQVSAILGALEAMRRDIVLRARCVCAIFAGSARGG